MDSIEFETVLIIGDYGTGDDAEEFEKPFRERRLELVRLPIDEIPPKFNFAKAILVADFPGKFQLIRECFAQVFPEARDHGLALVVLCHNESDFTQIEGIRIDDKSGAEVWIRDVPKLYLAAEDIARFKSGPRAGAVDILPPDVELKEGESLLLRRAFNDCEKIHLEPMTGGKASLSVFRVHAWLNRPIAGPSPLPFFAKIAEPEEVKEEIKKYHDYAEHYIPFNLRPNIDTSRCVQARTKAALIGNFVDDAIPLRQALRLGFGIGALFSMFETTLKGFRLQPFAKGKQPEVDHLKNFVDFRISMEKWKTKEAVVKRAAELGFTSSVKELRDKIYAAASALTCIIGPTHGDLHTGNAMVRGDDAILIDFALIMDGPLTADPANLEVSLMFGTESFEKSGSFPTWKDFIDEIYGSPVSSLHPPALFESQPGPFSWLRRSLRELRHVLLACNASTEEAKIILAAFLMRFARQDVEYLTESDAQVLALNRHAYALVIAERMVKGFGPEKTVVPAA